MGSDQFSIEADAFSFGGGVQSMAALVLAATGRLPIRRFIFANTGDDAEHPATLAYIAQVAKPYAAAHGLALEEVQARDRQGLRKSLYQHLLTSRRSVPIPMRMSETGMPGRRSCTADYKIKVIDKRLRSEGATPAHRATVGLGITLDEVGRMSTDYEDSVQHKTYPLMALGLDRAACVQIIARAGLVVPPKSACWFCPYHSRRRWQEMRQTEPDLFWQAVTLEDTLNARRASLGRDPAYLHSALRPLDQATSAHTQGNLFAEEGSCETGYCMV